MKYFVEQWGFTLLYASTAVVIILAVYSWGSQLGWEFEDLSSYQIFPVLGLIAFSLMLMHYPSGILRRLAPKALDYESYFLWTSRIVLILILLHPGLLILQRYADGFGLPPGSYLSYVASGMKLAVTFGAISLAVFLFFEFKKVLQNKPWWHLIEHGNHAAMILVWIHAFQLGSHIYGWYRSVWYAYGVLLVVSIIYFYTHPKQTDKPVNT